ncbi:MAG: type II toxin-antitoxin system RelE/ParE family toxin [Thermodesulfobacteriota bacterium]|nr:type II toxin-antitoxin system RelE/ParE family toxin [Thermodesulfobacteriota bacterium]
MKIKILKSAKNDLREGFDFYEFQQTGLGTYFLETLSSDIESLKLFAGIHSIHFEKYYRLLSKRFPFAVYYQLNKNESNRSLPPQKKMLITKKGRQI